MEMNCSIFQQIMLVLFFFVTRNTFVTGDVKLIRTEIKRNNITLPQHVAFHIKQKQDNTIHIKSVNETKPNTIPQNNMISAKTASNKGEKKSEVYVVNNGLLLLHPKKVVTVPGIKKSTEPILPAINYHVIKKMKGESNSTDFASKVLESHMKKRSLQNVVRKGERLRKVLSKELLRTARRVKNPTMDHGRITSINHNHKITKRRSQRKHLSMHGKKSLVFDKVITPYEEHPAEMTLEMKESSKKKKTEIENPLFDSDQGENEQQKHFKRKHRKGHKRTNKNASKRIQSISKIPDIRKYFDKIEDVPQYPRFGIRSFEGSIYPRFPLSASEASIYPRFPERLDAFVTANKYPAFESALKQYSRYPELGPALEFPRTERSLRRFSEFPHFEGIKPLELEDAPRFPEATPIPEIKEIGDADKRSRSKRERIPMGAADRFNDDDNDDADDDDGDDDDDYTRNSDIFENMYSDIEPIGAISHIHAPPEIPDIPDIPFLQEIPPLHGIKGLHPISPLKSIKSIDKTGAARSMPAAANDAATIRSNNVNVKEEGNTTK
eukprot:Seg1702.3 transcript_id=Seg1702.3/GoldUCD/mRNA.D3Y31 product="hypothetical protein" protein_id=Seg1702.3/GoldUCD/D3Y31